MLPRQVRNMTVPDSGRFDLSFQKTVGSFASGSAEQYVELVFRWLLQSM
jgi:hypothetical protein